MKTTKAFIVGSAFVLSGALLSGCSSLKSLAETPDSDFVGVPDSTEKGKGTQESTSVSESDEVGVSSESAAYPGAPFVPELGSFESIPETSFTFNPCTDIPQGFFEDLKLRNFRQNHLLADPESSCMFDAVKDQTGAHISIRSTPYPIISLEQLPGTVTRDEISEGVPVLANQPDAFQGMVCTSAVDTVGGAFHVTYQITDLRNLPEDMCVGAISWLKRILELDGKYVED